MATCFLNNVYCYYLPSHCSHGLQPLDNGVFNAVKTAYGKELDRLASLTDSAPVDKVNFIRAYATARQTGMTTRNILSGWRTTGNWPISRSKALGHPEIQEGKVKASPEYRHVLGSDDTPKSSRHIRDLGKNKTPTTRRRYAKIAKGWVTQEQTVAEHGGKIARLEEEVDRLKRGRKRRAIPNPNRRFIRLAKALAAGEIVPKIESPKKVVVVDCDSSQAGTDSETETASVIEVKVSGPPQRTTRPGRIIKRPRTK